MKILASTAEFEFYSLSPNVSEALVNFAVSTVPAGFPSPAEDFSEVIDLNKYLISNPLSTFLVRVKGKSMEGARIFDGSVLVVDRSIEPKVNSTCLCILDGDFTVKKVRRDKDKIFLVPENPSFREIEVKPEMEFEVWGVVTKIIYDPD